MSDTEVILSAIGKSADGFLHQVDKLADTVTTLNTTIVKLDASFNHQSESHTNLKGQVDTLSVELSDVTKEVDELKIYAKVRHNRRVWWSNNWSKILTTAILCGSAISALAILYNNIKPDA